MAMSAFDDKSKRPKPGDIEKALGRTFTHWDNLIKHIATEYWPMDQMWGFASAKWGWAVALKQKKRTVLYMTPCEKHFIVGLALGEKAVKAAHDAKLPNEVLEMIDGATKYAEGRAIRLEIRNKKDLDNVKKLAAVKMAN
jgi:hypothetical protein